MKILRTPEAANYLQLSKSTLEKMRLTGTGPAYIKLSARAVGYAQDSLDTYLRSRGVTSTSEAASGGQ